MATYADIATLMNPRSLAIVGASEGPGLGGNVTRNVVSHSSFDGDLYLVSRSRAEIMGRATVASLDDITDDLDVVLVVVPREHVPEVLRQAQRRNTAFAVVMSAGFAEAGDEFGLVLESEVRDVLSAGSMRMVGPNCPGVGDIRRPLGLTIQPGFKDELLPGPVGVIAQSGGLTRSLLQSSHRGVGFSYFFSPGNQTDLDIADFANFLVEDPGTKAIALAVEHFPSGRRFASVAGAAQAAGKPIVLLKSGTSEAGRAAAISHTGAIVGSQAALEAVARRLGIRLVDDVNHLINVAVHRSRMNKMRRGPHALVFGMSGGSAVVATDALARQGVQLATLSPQTVSELEQELPDGVPPSNPLDLAAASFLEGSFERALRISAADPQVGVALVLFNAWYETHTSRFVDACRVVSGESDTPIVPVWMSPREGPELAELEHLGLLPCRSVTEAAVVARTLTTPAPPPIALTAPPRRPTVSLLDSMHGTLLEDSAKGILAAANIRVTRERVARTLKGGLAAATEIGFPVIMKIIHQSVTHRAGSGLVTERIADSRQLRSAWTDLQRAAADHLPPGTESEVLVAEFVEGVLEAHIGLLRDPEWGALVSVGLGGAWIEEFADASLIPLPTQPEDVENAIESSKLGKAFARFGVKDGGRRALREMVQSVGHLAEAEPRLQELDINPVILSAHDAVAVDALARIEDEV